MLFVSMFVWLSAFVLSVCHCLCLTVLLSVCLHQCLAAWACVDQCFSGLCLSVCLSRTSCASGFLCLLSVLWRVLLSCVGLGCLVPLCLGLSCLVLSACHQSVLSLCCVNSSSRSPSFVSPLVIPIVLFFVPSFVQSVSCSSFSHANAKKAQQLTFERFITAAPAAVKRTHCQNSRPPGMFWDDTSEVAM